MLKNEKEESLNKLEQIKTTMQMMNFGTTYIIPIEREKLFVIIVIQEML